LIEDGRTGLASAGCKPDEITFQFGADMRYFGQQNEVHVAFDADPRKVRDLAWLRETFEQTYEKLYSLRLPDVDVEVVIWRIVATGPLNARNSKPDVGSAPARAKGARRARFNGHDVETPIYDRRALAVDQVVAGPAIIEERETTIIILPGWRAKVDPTGCILAMKE
jgi:N-methylhydantoinase A